MPDSKYYLNQQSIPYKMGLEDKWAWQHKKLACKVKIESGNPAADELRARLREMAQRLAVENSKEDISSQNQKKNEKNRKKKASKLDDDEAVANTLAASGRAGIFNAPVLLEHVQPNPLDTTTMNINKRFLRVPKSPPRKVMMDLQKERLIRTGTVPHIELDHHNDIEFENRRNRRKSINHKKETSSPTPKMTSEEAAKHASVFKPYHGDLFGSASNNMGGMVYLSRMPNLDHPTHVLSQMPIESFNDEEDESMESPDLHTTESWEALSKEREAKLNCAKTLCAWSKHDANVTRLAEEGALEAIMRLSKEDDRKIRRYCASTFRHMSSKTQLCTQMIDMGSLPILAELAASSGDRPISRDCAVAMLNLTRMQGREGDLVEDGAVLAFIGLMNDNEDLAGVCARALFNLTCVDAPYVFIERVIKSFLGLASAATLEVKHICASALCNLSDLKVMRQKLVEEGVVQVLGLLARGAEAKTRRVCAVVLQSLASTKSCRQEMVSKGAVEVMYRLSSDSDANTLHYVASAMMRLAMDPANCSRIVNESGVSALCKICMRCCDVPRTTQPCAAAFQILSRQEETKVMMVTEQCIPAIVNLLRGSTDKNTQQFCLLALCNLLTVEENHLAVLQQGGLMSIINQATNDQEGIREACALALFNLSCGEAARNPVVTAGAVPAIMSIAELDDVQARTRCAATLCNLASEPSNLFKIVEDGVIPTFIALLKTGVPDTVKHCCAALCQLAQDSASCEKIVDLGAVPHIVAGVENGDISTKQSCCSVLSALSFQSRCRENLCSMGALTALISLAEMGDNDTSLRCALAFANLSLEPTVQNLMIKQGVLPILKKLSNSYSEENQMNVAKAFANLSCNVGSEKIMIEQDCVGALMMIGMVRSVHDTTKQVCIKALQNLLNESSVQILCEQGLVSLLSNFSKLSDFPTMRVCANIYNFLSSSEYGRKQLIEKSSALYGLLNLLQTNAENPDRTTQVIVGKTICNLLCHSECQAQIISVGAIAKMRHIATLGDTDSELNCSYAFFLICGEESNRNTIVATGAVPTIILLARSPNDETRWNAIRVIANLAQFEDTRESLLGSNVIGALGKIVSEGDANGEVRMLNIAARSLCNLALSSSYNGVMVEEGMVKALATIQARLSDDKTLNVVISNTLRCMSSANGTLELMLEDGAIELMAKLSDGSSEVAYDGCLTIFRLAQINSLRSEIIKRGGLEILGRVLDLEMCWELAASTCFLLSLITSDRLPLASESTGALLVNLALKSGDNLALTKNVSQSLFMLSKSEKSRDALVEKGLPGALVKLCKSDDSEVRASASQALKNLNSEGGDGLEEGTVTALIAISRGATDNSVSNFDSSSMIVPDVIDVDASRFALESEFQPFEFLYEFTPYTVPFLKEVGGDAEISGKGGLKAIPPPTMVAEGLPSVPVVEEEVEQKSEEEESLDKVMMFAKMGVPKELGDEELAELEEEENEANGNNNNNNNNSGSGSVANEDETNEKYESGEMGELKEDAAVTNPPLPEHRVPEPDLGGPKERQAKARRMRRSIQAKKKREAEGIADEPFDIQARDLGLY